VILELGGVLFGKPDNGDSSVSPGRSVVYCAWFLPGLRSWRINFVRSKRGLGFSLKVFLIIVTAAAFGLPAGTVMCAQDKQVAQPPGPLAVTVRGCSERLHSKTSSA